MQSTAHDPSFGYHARRKLIWNFKLIIWVREVPQIFSFTWSRMLTCECQVKSKSQWIFKPNPDQWTRVDDWDCGCRVSFDVTKWVDWRRRCREKNETKWDGPLKKMMRHLPQPPLRRLRCQAGWHDDPKAHRGKLSVLKGCHRPTNFSFFTKGFGRDATPCLG